jgi:hypothetical protein
MPLNEAQKVNIRRHLGFPVAGLPLVSPSGGTLASGNMGYRFLQAYGQLEFRMNNISGPEEAALTGVPTGIVALVGPAVSSAGLVYTVTISGGGLGSPVEVSYTTVSTDTQASVVANLASLVNRNTTLQTAGFVAINPFGFGPFSQSQPQTVLGGGQTGNPAIPIAQMEVVNEIPGVTSFVLATASSGSPSLTVLMQGQQMPPSATVSLVTNPATTLWGFLPICDWLDGAVPGTTQNLDTAKADVWIPRQDEIEARTKLYDYWRVKMYQFLFDDGNSDLGPRSGGIGGGYSRRSL